MCVSSFQRHWAGRLIVLAFALAVVTPVYAADVPDLDSAVDARFLDNHTLFGRSGFSGKAYIQREGPAVRFQLPAYEKGVEHTCLYSQFALGGDFEVMVSYEWLDVPQPTKGYGAGCGISVEAKGAGMLKLGRVLMPKKGAPQEFIVTRGTPEGGEMKYKNESFLVPPGRVKKGRLVMRREQGDITCLVGDDSSEEFEELVAGISFPSDIIDKVIFYADPGGSPTSMDVRFNQIRIKALRKATDPTQVESGGFPWWGTTLIVLAILGAIGYVYYRLLFYRRPAEA